MRRTDLRVLLPADALTTKAIETLVASYMDEVPLAAERAVERALTRAVVRSPSTRDKSARRAAGNSAMKRRAAAELEEVCEQLCKVVRARPGALRVMLADEMGVPVETLWLRGPMLGTVTSRHGGSDRVILASVKTGS